MTEPKGMFDFLRARGEEFFTRMSNELMGNPQFIRAVQTAYRGKEKLDAAVGQALRTMNVPTRSEFKRALARIEALERELAEQKRQAANGAAAAGPSGAAAKRAGATSAGKKAPARARKAARKSPPPSTKVTKVE